MIGSCATSSWRMPPGVEHNKRSPRGAGGPTPW